MTDKDIIPEEKLLEVYEHLMHHKYGYLEDLNKIYPGLAQYLIKEGTIGQGVNAKLQLRYHVTSQGEKIARIQYTALTLKTLEYGNKETNMQ